MWRMIHTRSAMSRAFKSISAGASTPILKLGLIACQRRREAAPERAELGLDCRSFRADWTAAD